MIRKAWGLFKAGAVWCMFYVVLLVWFLGCDESNGKWP